MSEVCRGDHMMSHDVIVCTDLDLRDKAGGYPKSLCAYTCTFPMPLSVP